MKLDDFGMDKYDRHARLRPALIILLPLTLTAIGLTPDAYKVWTAIIAVIAQAGGSYLLGQVVADAGKKKETQLFRLWGGRPSELLLSHKHAPNKILLASRHEKLALLLKNVQIPSAAMEEEDRTAAFQIYTAGCDKLRGIIRTQKETYADVHRENIAYGFRRNVWANRKTGIWINTLSLIVLAAVIGGAVSERTTVDVALPLIAIAEALLLLFWVFIVGPGWVRRPAVLYAERLLEALDTVV